MFQALTQLLRKRREAKVNNPSAFLTQAIKSSELVHGTAKVPNNRVNNATATYTKPDLCQSANQLLGWLHKEGLEPSQLDEACFAYLARCPPAIQTKVWTFVKGNAAVRAMCGDDSRLGFWLQALTNMLQQWRGQVAIVNPSAYLTKLLANAYHEDPPHEQDLLHAAKPDAQVCVQPITASSAAAVTCYDGNAEVLC